MQFVFILGIAKAASKTYRNILNRHTDIDIVNEMHYMAPRWIRRDFRSTVRRSLGYPVPPDRLSALVELLYSDTLEGTFWRMFPRPPDELRYRIVDLEQSDVEAALGRTDLRFRSIMEALPTLHADRAGKLRGGAKFPVNVADATALYRWFPDAKYLFLVRDPRAVYCSMKLTDENQAQRPSNLAAHVARARRIPYVIHQYRATSRSFQILRQRTQCHLCRFEDLIAEPEKTLRSVCAFLESPYRPEMLQQTVRGSSYAGASGTSGFDRRALERWKGLISPYTDLLLRQALARELRGFAYVP